MPTVNSVVYPDQPAPPCSVEPERCYFLVRLHQAQAYFEGGWLVRPGYLVFSSSVESTFLPGKATQSLYKVASLQKNVACQLGIRANLTNWLPARSSDSLHIELSYSVVQDSPLKDLLDQLGSVKLVAELTAIRPDMAAALKVSEIAGRLLSFALMEGGTSEIFQHRLDLNVSDLKAGYYTALSGGHNVVLPGNLKIKDDGSQVSLMGFPAQSLERCSYGLLQVMALRMKGEESCRGELWWELLQIGKEQAQAANPENDQERRKALEAWYYILAQVRALAARERSFLFCEVQEIIRAAQVDVQKVLMPVTRGEACGEMELPSALQELLGVSTEEELYRSVSDYNEALEVSRTLMEQYQA
jgi:hypothetical protein